MTLPETIQKAHEGGFKKGRIYSAEAYMYTRGLMNGDAAKDVFNDFSMSPSFWQSLGKAMGWGWLCRGCGERIVSDGGCEKYDCEGSEDAEYEEWLSWWHRFIDHLSKGKSIESFFLQF